MENKFTEREALRQMIEYIKEERQRLWDEYVVSIVKLAELDRLEKEEAEATTKPWEEDWEQLASKETGMTIEEAIDAHNTAADDQREWNKVPEDYGSLVVSQLDEPEITDYMKKNQGYRDVRTLTVIIASVLKEVGKPIKAKQLIKLLKKRGIDMNQPHSLLYQAKKYDPRIETPTHGYYQFRTTVTL